MTAIKVIDASALGAVLFAEAEAEAVAARLRGGSLVAPSLLGYEIGNVCLTKVAGEPGAARRVSGGIR